MGPVGDRFGLGAFAAAVVMIAWLAGALSARFTIFPYPLVESGIETVRKAFVSPPKFHRKTRELVGASAADPSRMAPGFTIVTTYFPDRDWQTGIRLLDRDGKVVHDWPFNLDDVAPNRNEQQDYVHGTWLGPQGDIVFNVEFAGLFRIDRCGKVLWRNEEIRSHHSVSPAPDGGFWVPGNRTQSNDAAGRAYLAPFKILRPELYEDLIVKVSAGGETERVISIPDVLWRNGLQRYVPKMARSAGGRGEGKGFSGDLFHMNDVEELSEAMAPDYPLFEAGDLVVSLRQLHMVLVVDPDDLKVKWFTVTATAMQHDPDFIGGGWIGIFDNNYDLTPDGSLAGGTRILAVRPHSGEERTLFPTGAAPPVYSEFGGKWQMLPNGNMLLAIAREGRALEVAPTGETVWEWDAPLYGDDHVPEVLEATRYQIAPETVAAWNCG